jgi:hypothetical protein
MVDVILSIFLVGTLACEIALVALAYRALSKVDNIRFPAEWT